MIPNLTPSFSLQKTHRQEGRFRCHSNNCLQPYQSMPDSFRLQNSNLTSILFTRDPLTRLVSAWKDKIDRVYGHEYYYNHFTKNILAMFHPKTPIPSIQKEAFDEGLTVTFKEFITWIRWDSIFIPKFCKIFEFLKTCSVILLRVKNESIRPNLGPIGCT